MIPILEYIKKTHVSDYVDTTIFDDRDELIKLLERHGFVEKDNHHIYGFQGIVQHGTGTFVTGRFDPKSAITHWIAIPLRRKRILFIRTIDPSMYDESRFKLMSNNDLKTTVLTADECLSELKIVLNEND